MTSVMLKHKKIYSIILNLSLSTHTCDLASLAHKLSAFFYVLFQSPFPGMEETLVHTSQWPYER